MASNERTPVWVSCWSGLVPVFLLSLLVPLGAAMAGGAPWEPGQDEGGLLSGINVQVTNRVAVRYYMVDDVLEGFEDRAINNYVEEVDRFNLLLSKGRMALGLQVDEVALFANRYILDGELYHSYDLLESETSSPWDDAYLTLEKLYGRYRSHTMEWIVGDGYVSFGRGLALNMARNTDIDLDTSLRGVKGSLHLGDWELTTVTGLTNAQQVQQEYPNLGIHPNIYHMVSGLRVERYGLGPATMGVHGVIYRFARDYDDGTPLVRYTEAPDVLVGGASLEAMGIGGVDFLVEGDYFDYRSSDFFGGEEPEPGYGFYTSASAYPGQFVLLLEAKRYVDTERVNTYPTLDGYEVAVAPSLEYERVITEDSSAAVNSNDIAGARLRVDYSGSSGALIPYLSFAVFRDWDTSELHFNNVPETIFHPLAGLQWTGAETNLLANMGWRTDIRDDDTGHDTLAHIDLDLLVPFGAIGDLELVSAARRFLWGVNAQQQSDYTEMENSLALHRGDHWTFILYQDFSDNPLVRSTGNLAEHLYAALELQYKPTTAITAKAFYGAYKAGIRCAGGQCRSLPGFEGLRFSLEGSI